MRFSVREFFLIFDCFQDFMTLCQSMRCSMPGRKTYNQIWPALPSSGDIFFEVSALQLSDVIAFCPVLLPSTVLLLTNMQVYFALYSSEVYTITSNIITLSKVLNEFQVFIWFNFETHHYSSNLCEIGFK